MLFIAEGLSRPASTREEYHKSWRGIGRIVLRGRYPDQNKTIRATLP